MSRPSWIRLSVALVVTNQGARAEIPPRVRTRPPGKVQGSMYRRVLLAVLATCAPLLHGVDLPVLAVLGFQSSGLSSAETSVFVGYLSSFLVATGRYRVVAAEERDRLLAQQEFALSDCSDQECQVEIGRLLAADEVVVGNVGLFQGRYLLSMALLDVESGQTLRTGSEMYETVDALVRGAEYIAYLIAGDDARFQARKREIDAEARRRTNERKATEAQAARRQTLEGIRAGIAGAVVGVDALTIDVAGGLGASFAGQNTHLVGANVGGNVWFGRYFAFGPVVGFMIEEADPPEVRAQIGLLLAARIDVGDREGFGFALDIGYLNTGGVYRGLYYSLAVRLDFFLVQVTANARGLFAACGAKFLLARL